MSEAGMENNQTPTQPARRRAWGRRIAFGALLVGLGLVAGQAINNVYGEPGMFGHGWHHHGPFDPRRMAERIDHRVDRVLTRINATQEQKDKVASIFRSATNDVTGLGVHPWEMRQKLIQLLSADKIDTAAVEALRAEQVSKFDSASKRMVQAMTEAAEVLTPEQRHDLAQRFQERFSHWGPRDRHGPPQQPGNAAPQEPSAPK